MYICIIFYTIMDNQQQSFLKKEECSEAIQNGVNSSELKSGILDECKPSNKDMVQSLRKLKVVNSLYKITNIVTNGVYIGITKRPLLIRFNQHIKASERSNSFNKFYNAIKKYGKDNFKIELLNTYNTYEELLEAEIKTILEYKENNKLLYNTIVGNRPLPKITNKEEWKSKLKEKRKNRKPALNMKHTEENKKLFSACGKYRWDIYGRYPEEVVNFSFKEAKAKYNISKTHYYRLLKQSKNNELT